MPRFLSIVLVSLPYLFILSAFLGIIPDWALESYDSWRLIEVAIISVILASAVLVGRFQCPLMFLKKKSGWFTLFFTGIGLSVCFAAQPELALLDMCWWMALTGFFVAFLQLQRQFSIRIIENFLLVMALAPLWIIVWFLLGYYLYFNASMALVWHGLFANIRYYDDALLPCLFVLWYQPSYLKRHSVLVTFIASLYLLTLWIDAARANWLAIFLSLASVAVLYKSGYKKIMVPIFSIVLSFIWYQLLIEIQPQIANYTVIRNDSHVRATMWWGSFSTWLEYPLLGIGGANFVGLNPEINLETVGHPHNLFLQLLVEWGLAGIAIVIGIFYGYYSLARRYQQIPILLFAGAVAFLINALLSGAYIYPISQMAMLLVLNFIAYHITKIEVADIVSINQTVTNRDNYFYWMAILAIIVVILLIVPSAIQQNNSLSKNTSWGPRFWSNAKQAKLPIEITDQ